MGERWSIRPPLTERGASLPYPGVWLQGHILLLTYWPSCSISITSCCYRWRIIASTISSSSIRYVLSRSGYRHTHRTLKWCSLPGPGRLRWVGLTAASWSSLLGLPVKSRQVLLVQPLITATVSQGFTSQNYITPLSQIHVLYSNLIL